METAVFLENFREILQAENPIRLDDTLKTIPEWDSIAVLATVAWLDKIRGLSLTFEDIARLNTVAEVAKLAGAGPA